MMQHAWIDEGDAEAENALRIAHRRLHLDIRPEYPATQLPASGRPWRRICNTSCLTPLKVSRQTPTKRFPRLAPVTRDVLLELLDDEFLLGNDVFHQVTDGD